MTIGSLDDLASSVRQLILYSKNPASVPRLAVGTVWQAIHDTPGIPAPVAALAVGNTANGIVPTSATTGFPPINAFATGYLTAVEFTNILPCRLMLYDRLFHAGDYSFAAGTTTLASQPSYAARVPGADYKGLQIWFESATLWQTGNNWNATVTYTNAAGVAGRTATLTGGPFAAGSFAVSRLMQFALQSGDSGVQKIESVIVTNGVTAMTSGSFNVFVARPLWAGRVLPCGTNVTQFLTAVRHGIEQVGMPPIYSDSALCVMTCADSASFGLGVPDLMVEISAL